MTILAWLLMSMAVLVQLMSFVVAIGRPSSSQVPLVPCILWYIALVIRDDAFFFSSKGLELSVVFVVHLVLTVAARAIGMIILKNQ